MNGFSFSAMSSLKPTFFLRSSTSAVERPSLISVSIHASAISTALAPPPS
jgi:hypothetical protein